MLEFAVVNATSHLSVIVTSSERLRLSTTNLVVVSSIGVSGSAVTDRASFAETRIERTEIAVDTLLSA